MSSEQPQSDSSTDSGDTEPDFERFEDGLFSLLLLQYIGIVLTAVCLVTAGAAAPAVAQQDESTVDRLVTVTLTIAESPQEFADGVAASISLGVANLRGSQTGADEEAERVRSWLDDNSQSVTDHANLVADENGYEIGNGTYTYAVTVGNGNTQATFYIVATADGETIQGYEAINDTSNSVNQRVTLSTVEAQELNEDIREYNETYIKPGRVPDDGYYLGKTVKYGGQVEIA